MRPVFATCLSLLLVLPVAVHAAPRSVLRAGSEIGFQVTQMGVAVSGRFARFDARIDWVADDPAKSSAEVSVDIGSLTTGDADADAIALDKPWLNQSAFPQAKFTSTAIRRSRGDYLADGSLTIRGRSRQAHVPFKLTPQADGTLLVEGELSIRRTDFGVGGGEWNEGELVADEVPVRFRLRLAAP
jgi:polyisoprenoid-binding protein YceI